MVEPVFPSPPHVDWAASAPATPVTPVARRGGRSVGLVLAASVLSAALASGTTAALVGRASAEALTVAAPGTVAAPVTAATAITATTVAADTSTTLSSIAQSAAKAVVTINTTTTATVGRFGQQVTGMGVGSGFIVASDGWIVTAAHVVEGASELTVTLADGRTLAGTVAASDLRNVRLFTVMSLRRRLAADVGQLGGRLHRLRRNARRHSP